MKTQRTIEFLRRRNLGNYEHAELKVADVIPEGANQVAYTKELMSFVEDALYQKGSFAAPVENNSQLELNMHAGTTVTEKKAEEKVTKAKTKKESTEKVETPKNENPKEGEVTTSDPKPQGTATSTSSEASTTSTVDVNTAKSEDGARATQTAKPDEKKERVGKPKAGKNTPYERTLENHKSLIGTMMDAAVRGWRDPSVLPKAGKASREMNGKDFLDSEGNVLESFKTEFLAIYNAA